MMICNIGVMNKRYITTAIAYVNGSPHVGHALELVQADALARFSRFMGHETYFLTGTDEHGVKIYEKSKEEGVDVGVFVDGNAAKFKRLVEVLNISNDDFIRTTELRHKDLVRQIWVKLMDNGDLYKDSYEGLYCVGCEAFVLEKDLSEDGMCRDHLKKPVLLKEENYFFRLSKYSDQIGDLIEKDVVKIRPEGRKREFLNMMAEGLFDVSFSRPKKVLPWGIEVPNDPDHVMYVWCDALTNYITALGFEDGDLFKKFWPADSQIIGKDILRFHAGIWIGMLLSLGLEVPKAINVHGMITSGGVKMGKSLGNVIDPFIYVEEFGCDAVRWYLLKEIPTLDDGDFSRERFLEVYNNELANGIGNLVNRVLMMLEKYNEGVIPDITVEGSVVEKFEEFKDKVVELFEKYDLKAGCEVIFDMVDWGNKYIDDMKPWVMAKEENAMLNQILGNLIFVLKNIGGMLGVVMPGVGAKILVAIGEESNVSFSQLGQDLQKGFKVQKPDILFPRLDKV
ncbi:methionine--tRNA ligase [Candidatus Peregrinibacteria bacterium HGW-Peregrinibacteria-1]|nr:MAG: methionine--tRNA ligase [Candidatus Peregrinibacteria bacterium HGW-Peregrinibacteria-1]